MNVKIEFSLFGIYLECPECRSHDIKQIPQNDFDGIRMVCLKCNHNTHPSYFIVPPKNVSIYGDFERKVEERGR